MLIITHSIVTLLLCVGQVEFLDVKKLHVELFGFAEQHQQYTFLLLCTPGSEFCLHRFCICFLLTGYFLNYY